MKVAVLIVTYNGLKWIEQCLESVYNSSIDVEIIVVDNKSTDTTAEFIKNKFSTVTFIQSEENLGFGQGNNIGLTYASEHNFDYVFLLNQDAYVDTDTIKKLVEASSEHTEYGMLSPVHFNGPRTDYDKGFIKYVTKNRDRDSFVSEEKQDSSKIYDVDFVNAAAWLLPKKTIDIIGGFDPIFFHYGEDDNYCQRLKYHQLKLGVLPSAKVIHDRTVKEKTTLRFTDEYFKLYERSLKTLWGNILVESIDSYVALEKKKFLKDTVKEVLKLKFNNLKHLRRKKNIFRTSLKQIEGSRHINITQGKHYL